MVLNLLIVTPHIHVNTVGSGYVGATLTACLADLGHEVTAINTTNRSLTASNSSFFSSSAALEDLFETHVDGRLHATTSYKDLAASDVTLLSIGTPSATDGSIDTGPLSVASEMV